ncbi:UDP-N-acetylglucosamine acyltransferase, partial [Pasteurella multocida subsp. multocida str. Anand1_cattle]
TLEEVMPEIEQVAAKESAISFFVEFFKRSTRGIIR